MQTSTEHCIRTEKKQIIMREKKIQISWKNLFKSFLSLHEKKKHEKAYIANSQGKCF